MLLQNLRAKVGARLNAKSEEGFTLIELLVVMLILGILAAIALPAFFNQQDKAGDSEAKSNVRTAQTAMETCATENGGEYGPCDVEATLEAIEPTLTGATLSFPVAADANSYSVRVTSDTGNTFDIVRASTGAISYPCGVAAANGTNRGGCPTGNTWD